MKDFAQIVSYLFVPPINLQIIFILLAYQIYDESVKLHETILIATLFGLILPISVFIYFRSKGKIIDNDASLKGERNTPYFIGILLTMAAFILSVYLKLHPFIISLWISYLLTSFLLLLINIYWKISAHAIGIAIPSATLYFLFGIYSLPFILIIIAVLWSRIYLGLHTITQVIIGFLLGYSVTSILLNNSLRWF